MKAEEAFKMAQDVINKKEQERLDKIKDNKQFQSILSKIKESAEKGNMAIAIKESNRDFAEILKTLGYQVEFYGNNEMKINWCCKD